jgi:hypothetical protein
MNIPISTGKATTKLPAKLLKEIGRVVAVFSCIEHETKLITYALLHITPQEGRLAIKEPRIKDSFATIKSLMEIHGITVTHNIDAISSDIAEMESVRDWLAHGVWAKINGGIHLQITSGGKWQPPGAIKGVSRKIIPAVAPVSHAHIQKIAFVGEELLAVVADVHKQILEQQKPYPSRHSTGTPRKRRVHP